MSLRLLRNTKVSIKPNHMILYTYSPSPCVCNIVYILYNGAALSALKMYIFQRQSLQANKWKWYTCRMEMQVWTKITISI
jgi:hypothetical protein